MNNKKIEFGVRNINYIPYYILQDTYTKHKLDNHNNSSKFDCYVLIFIVHYKYTAYKNNKISVI